MSLALLARVVRARAELRSHDRWSREHEAQLDAERAAAAQPPVDPGICEVAEAEVAHTH